MKKLMLIVLVMAAMVVPVLAQDSVTNAAVTTAVAAAAGAAPSMPEARSILADVLAFLKALQGGDLLAALIVLVNLVLNFLKMPWFEKALTKLLRKTEQWRWTPRTKIAATLVAGVALAYFLNPAKVWWRTIGKGVVIALAAMGAHDVVQYLVKGETHAAKAAGLLARLEAAKRG